MATVRIDWDLLKEMMQFPPEYRPLAIRLKDRIIEIEVTKEPGDAVGLFTKHWHGEYFTVEAEWKIYDNNRNYQSASGRVEEEGRQDNGV